MLKELLLNPVSISVFLLMFLSIIRLNVVFSLIIAAITGGLLSGIGEEATMKAFSTGLGNGANIAFNYAMLGAFSIAISRSGITELLAQMLFKKINGEVTSRKIFIFSDNNFDTGGDFITEYYSHTYCIYSDSDTAAAGDF